MCQGGLLQKDENEEWDLYENLAEKTIQWEPTSETSRNPNSISSKGGLHSIESSIANEAKLANIARRLEALETKEPSPVNQVSPNQFPTPGCTYCQAMNHVFEECPVFQAQQQYHEPMNAAFSRPNNNPYAPTYPDSSALNHPASDDDREGEQIKSPIACNKGVTAATEKGPKQAVPIDVIYISSDEEQ